MQRVSSDDRRNASSPPHEVTGAGRIWFLIEDESRTVWLKDVSVGHPKTTE
jgi:hypothetical protein